MTHNVLGTPTAEVQGAFEANAPQAYLEPELAITSPSDGILRRCLRFVMLCYTAPNPCEEGSDNKSRLHLDRSVTEIVNRLYILHTSNYEGS